MRRQSKCSGRHAVLRHAPRVFFGGLCGLVTAGIALGIGELVAAFTGPQTAPVFAVGAAAIDLTPTPLKDYATRTYGTNDKFMLLLGIFTVLGLIAVAAGVLAMRWLWTGIVLVALFGAVGVVAALTRPDAGNAAALPSAFGGAIAVGVLILLVRAYPQRRPVSRDTETHAAPADPPALDRRAFVRATGGAAALGAVAGVAGWSGQALISRRYNVSAARAAVRIPAPAVTAPAVPPGVHPNVPGLSPFFTPNTAFYRVDTALTLPQVDPRSWTLRVHGMVDTPLEISFDDLLRRELVEHDYTLSCVSNEVGGPYVGTARWIGAALPDLLREAGVQRGATQLVGRSVDGMTIGTPVETVLDGRAALLAVAMNGEALPIAHGFPCRMLVPGLYGYVSATKWLVDLELTTFAGYDPYWVQRGWAREAPVKTASRIDVPKSLARVNAGSTTVAGVAWATHRGIDAVEVRVDSGPWLTARLAPADGSDTWRQWTCEVDLTPGLRQLQVRATDATGATQTAQRQDVFPDGATGWHTILVTVA